MRGLQGIPDNELHAASVDLPEMEPGMLKVVPLCLRAAEEAIADARLHWPHIDSNRVGCAVAAHMGDSRWLQHLLGIREFTADDYPWTGQWLPNSACAHVARRFGLMGPRVAHSTACATSLIAVVVASRLLQDDQCDAILAGGGEGIDPLFAAGFRQMRVLAEARESPAACRPFDRNRNGFVMGEGAGMLVLEKRSHALARGANIYAEILGSHILCEAHHVTGLDVDSSTLSRLLRETLRKSDLKPADIGYINAHATGTTQNDLVEMRAIRDVFGERRETLTVSGTKSMLGHMINAAGAVELSITLLGLRDGIAPPTINLTDVDPECTFDCVPRTAKPHQFDHAMKISVVFVSLLKEVALRRWNVAQSRTRAA
jgi:3-oxoacyl-(acyl-carrier-protein) synthase